MTELTHEQKLRLHYGALGLQSIGLFLGVKNWKKSKWWKGLAIYTGVGIPVNLIGLSKELQKKPDAQIENK